MGVGAERRARAKGRRDENFPVASWLTPRRLRPHVVAFYGFARAASEGGRCTSRRRIVSWAAMKGADRAFQERA